MNNAPFQAMTRQFLQENAGENSVISFTEVWADNIHSFSLIHQMGDFAIAADQVGQAGPAFPMLAGPDALGVLYMLCNGTPDVLLHNTNI